MEYDVCLVCKMKPFPGQKLIRLTWVGREPEPKLLMYLGVAKVLKPNDLLMCDGCLRKIKQIPFSTFNDNPPWTPREPSNKREDDGGEEIEIPF